MKCQGITGSQSKIHCLLGSRASGNVMFAATGVTTGAMLKGVRRFHGGAITHSLVMRSKSHTVRYIEAHHRFEHDNG